MVDVKIKTEDELFDVCKELLHITFNLRHFTKLWEESYGVELRNRKKYWENKLDALLKRLEVTEHRQSNQIKIEVSSK